MSDSLKISDSDDTLYKYCVGYYPLSGVYLIHMFWRLAPFPSSNLKEDGILLIWVS
jgi:hypothetical protein